MLRPRIIPCLLIHQGGLVKTIGFEKPTYVGDPINAVRIFNEKECDEIIVVDIDATVDGVNPDFKTIAQLAAECRMPLCYGGGIRSVAHAKRIIGLGVEKVAMSAAAVEDPDLVEAVSVEVGRQSVAVVIDYKKKRLGRGHDLWTHNAKRNAKLDPIGFAQQMQDRGAGEIILNSIDRDGRMSGYDVAMAQSLREALTIPVTIMGGAGSLADIEQLVEKIGIVGAAAGSLFVFKGNYRAVLINYPQPDAREQLIQTALSRRASA